MQRLGALDDLPVRVLAGDLAVIERVYVSAPDLQASAVPLGPGQGPLRDADLPRLVGEVRCVSAVHVRQALELRGQQQSPWLSIANRQFELMGRYLAELRLKRNAALWTARTVAASGTCDLFLTMNKEAAGNELR